MSVRGSIAAALSCLYDAMDELSEQRTSYEVGDFEKRVVVQSREIERLLEAAPKAEPQTP